MSATGQKLTGGVAPAAQRAIADSLSALAQDLHDPKPNIDYLGMSKDPRGRYQNMVFYKVEMKADDHSPRPGKQGGFGYVLTVNGHKLGLIVIGGDGETHSLITQITPAPNSHLSENEITRLQIGIYRDFVMNFEPAKAWHSPSFQKCTDKSQHDGHGQALGAPNRGDGTGSHVGGSQVAQKGLSPCLLAAVEQEFEDLRKNFERFQTRATGSETILVI
ncbi:hypothetical protein BDP27DRAFT_1502148 [Rhodocollybia butyracea]|uniref:Uncharacterized protein n=1 Tax=Rhodocollybia butyracea TaxID=206335 RepID=A0A9P5U9W8_9AGAR|nr:hypothetical protein BDP27DRAFT_1502148 [Rhodocollybia butyracea]